MEFHEYTQKMDEPTPFSIKNLSELELTLPLPLVECPEDKHGDINTTENESAHIPDASVPSETMTQTVNETQHDYPDTDSKSQPKDPGQGLEAVIETQLPNQSDLDGESLSQGMDCDDPGDGPGDVGDQMDQMDVESAEMVEPHTKAAEVDADAAKGSDSIQDSLRRFLNPDDSIDMSNLLTNAASFYIKKAREISSQSMLSLPKGELTLASLCAGSGTGELAFHATVHQLSEEFLKPLDAKVLFCCEKVPWKQQYLMANIVSKDTCVFDDVVTLGALADRKFPLPESFKNEDFSNCSVSTFFGTMGTIAATKPKLVILENVDSIGNEHVQDSNLCKVCEEIKAVDEAMKRIYIIAVRLDGAVTSTDPAPFFDMVGRMLDAFKIGSLSVKSVLLADDDPYLLAELQRRKQHRQDQESRIKKGEISKEYFLSFVYLYALVFFPLLQGYPVETLPGAFSNSDVQLADLAGNSFSSTVSDIALAKTSACRPPECEKRRRQKLWLRIVEHQAATSDVQKIIGLIKESQELTIRDVLPYLSDSMTIEAFQSEICECLDAYEGQIVTLRQEMDDHRRALSAFKEDLKRADERCIVVGADQCCEICGCEAMRERFYAFTCTHCCHEACLRALILPTLSPARRERLFKLEDARLQHQAAAAGANAAPMVPLAEVEDELDGLLAEDCPFCGQLMIDTITKPFLDPNDEGDAEEIESWAI
ncbi:unnamed protein product [Durusdinium trenchii]|uniref:Pep3/Vps18 RING C-terminal domain-containing protein n=1 Tax=Durusdinium trenchii TaxID=1381693 RepID=A0ABP0Q647_9DINO